VRITELTAEHAADIATWQYPPPYDRYDLVGTDPEFLLDPANGYVAVVDDSDTLVGYRCFGPDGRVADDDSALDTGGGLRPALTGRGLGREAIEAGLAYGRERYAPPAFRVTVWAANDRALRVVGSLGFGETQRFLRASDGSEYVVLVRPQR
jgi:RimJ/RimL family protein N-acetyltransferase